MIGRAEKEKSICFDVKRKAYLEKSTRKKYFKSFITIDIKNRVNVKLIFLLISVANFFSSTVKMLAQLLYIITFIGPATFG